MAGRNRIHLYLSPVAVIVILLAASQATDAHFANLCAKTTYPTLCYPLVKGPGPRKAAHDIIRALETKTRCAIEDAGRFSNGNLAVTICHATLTDAAFNLGKARRRIRTRNVLALRMFLNLAISDYGVCVDGFVRSGQVNMLQNAADELRKIGTNCLFITTLIR